MSCMSCVVCHVLYGHVLYVMCCMSCVVCHELYVMSCMS